VLTSRQRLHRCYTYQELDRPGVYCRTGFPKGDPSYDGLKAYLGAVADLKVRWRVNDHYQPYPLRHHTEPRSEDFERHVTTLPTPAGELVSTRLVSLKGQPGMVERHLLDGRADAEKYLSLPIPEPRFDVDSFFQADREVGDRGIVHLLLPSNPGGKVAAMFGSERFAMLSITDRDILHALCEREMQIILKITEYLLAAGAGPYFGLSGEEMIVPPLHGPDDFRDFNLRYDKPIADRIHDAGGYVHVHCHGSIRRVMDGFVEMGVDVLHPFEAPPMGDITPAQAKEKARGQLCLEGNIQISEMYESPPEAIAEQTEWLIAETFDDRCGLIVSPTASPYVRGAGQQCLPQFEAMIETVRGWKKQRGSSA